MFQRKEEKIKQPRRQKIYFLFEKMYNREKIQTWTQLGSCFSAQVSGGLFALLPNVLFAQVPGGLFRTNQDHFLGFRH